MDKLIVHKEGQVVREVELADGLTIGRRSDCHVSLDSLEISRLHAVVRGSSGAWKIEDQGSANGTALRGAKLAAKQPIALANGDRLSIPPFELVVALEAVEEPTRTIEYRAPDVPVAPARPAPAAQPAPLAPPVPPAPAPQPVAAPAKPASRVRADLVDGLDGLARWQKGETTLVLAHVTDETHDARTFRFIAKDPTLFTYQPGQFLTISVPIDGEIVKRSYTISSSPSRPHAIELTIKRCPNGLVSNWMNDNAKPGDTFTVRGPGGKFSCFQHPTDKALMLAAGSGITPIMSMLRWVTDTSVDMDVALLYSVRSPADIIFGRELEHLAARHENIRVVITSTAPRARTLGWTGPTCRADRRLIELVAPDILERDVFMCGPKPFADAMKAELAALGHAPERLFQESFGGPPAPKKGSDAPPSRPAPVAVAPPPQQPVPRPVPPPAPVEQPHEFTQPFQYGKAAAPAPRPVPPPPAAQPVPAAGHRISFRSSNANAVDDGEQSLLEAGESAGLELPYSCREGQCGTCRTRCASGTVVMRDNDLSDDERAAGWIYLCVARPTSDVVLEA